MNAKGELITFCQHREITQPRYYTTNSVDSNGCLVFNTRVHVGNLFYEGTATTKRGAEAQASERALLALSKTSRKPERISSPEVSPDGCDSMTGFGSLLSTIREKQLREAVKLGKVSPTEIQKIREAFLPDSFGDIKVVQAPYVSPRQIGIPELKLHFQFRHDGIAHIIDLRCDQTGNDLAMAISERTRIPAPELRLQIGTFDVHPDTKLDNFELTNFVKVFMRLRGGTNKKKKKEGKSEVKKEKKEVAEIKKAVKEVKKVENQIARRPPQKDSRPKGPPTQAKENNQFLTRQVLLKSAEESAEMRVAMWIAEPETSRPERYSDQYTNRKSAIYSIKRRPKVFAIRGGNKVVSQNSCVFFLRRNPLCGLIISSDNGGAGYDCEYTADFANGTNGIVIQPGPQGMGLPSVLRRVTGSPAPVGENTPHGDLWFPCDVPNQPDLRFWRIDSSGSLSSWTVAVSDGTGSLARWNRKLWVINDSGDAEVFDELEGSATTISAAITIAAANSGRYYALSYQLLNPGEVIPLEDLPEELRNQPRNLPSKVGSKVGSYTIPDDVPLTVALDLILVKSDSVMRHLSCNEIETGIQMMQSCLVDSRQFRVSNGTPWVDLSGFRAGCMLAPGSDYRQFMSYDTIASLPDALPKEMTKGMNCFLGRSGPMDAKPFTNIRFKDGNITKATYPFIPESGVYAGAFKVSDGVTFVGQGNDIVGIELITESVWTNSEFPPNTEDAWFNVGKLLKKMPPHTENPSHLKTLFNKFRSGIRSAVGFADKYGPAIQKYGKMGMDVAREFM